MPLETGLYIIRSKIDDREVGRYPIEDRSLGPKPLFALREPIHRPTVSYPKLVYGRITYVS